MHDYTNLVPSIEHCKLILAHNLQMKTHFMWIVINDKRELLIETPTSVKFLDEIKDQCDQTGVNSFELYPAPTLKEMLLVSHCGYNTSVGIHTNNNFEVAKLNPMSYANHNGTPYPSYDTEYDIDLYATEPEDALAKLIIDQLRFGIIKPNI